MEGVDVWGGRMEGGEGKFIGEKEGTWQLKCEGFGKRWKGPYFCIKSGKVAAKLDWWNEHAMVIGATWFCGWTSDQTTFHFLTSFVEKVIT